MLTCCLLAVLSVSLLSLAAQAAEPQLAHMVFFKLKDNSTANQAKLVASCDKYLNEHEGIIYYSAGARVSDLKRPVNDQDFDVALHVVFKTRAAHDKYQSNPRHLQFIKENNNFWSNVRVFDSYVRSPK